MPQLRVDEEAIILEKIAEVPLPAGVRFKSLAPFTEWTGEDAWEITFTVAKKVRLTTKFLDELGEVRQALYDRCLSLEIWQMAVHPIYRGKVDAWLLPLTC